MTQNQGECTQLAASRICMQVGSPPFGTAAAATMQTIMICPSRHSHGAETGSRSRGQPPN